MNNKKQKKNGIFVIGDFTVPINGRSKITYEMLLRLKNKINIKKINIGTNFKLNRIISLFPKLLRYTSGLITIYQNREKFNSAYLCISGGYGQLFDIFFLILLKLTNKKILIHHHSFAYIDKFKLLFFLISIISGKNTLHIVLGKNMGDLLKKKYVNVKKTYTLSNICFFEKSNYSKKINFTKNIRIGFMSNISFEKGIDTFLDTVEKLNKFNIQAIIAGPFVNAKVKNYVFNKIKHNKNIKYIGPIYGKKKNIFFKKIDIFLFPSVYPNEAEPLVLYEAISKCVPVITNIRGSIKNIINKKSGYLIKDASTFSKKAFMIIKKINQNKKKLNELIISTNKDYNNKIYTNKESLKKFILLITSNSKLF